LVHFVEIMPGKDGLLHISEISWERLETMDGVMKEGDKVEVKLLDVDKQGKMKLSRKVLLPRPEKACFYTSVTYTNFNKLRKFIHKPFHLIGRAFFCSSDHSPDGSPGCSPGCSPDRSSDGSPGHSSDRSSGRSSDHSPGCSPDGSPDGSSDHSSDRSSDHSSDRSPGHSSDEQPVAPKLPMSNLTSKSCVKISDFFCILR
jgi:hypothetical protein